MSPDFRLQVRLYYQGQLVRDVTTSTVDGCWILQGSVPVENERIYGPCTAEQVRFPPPKLARVSHGIAEAMARLLPHLERGVLLWVAPDGVFTKRFCQGRVYWRGPLAQHQDKPNKLEREKTCKLLDMPIFLKGVFWGGTAQKGVKTLSEGYAASRVSDPAPNTVMWNIFQKIFHITVFGNIF